MSPESPLRQPPPADRAALPNRTWVGVTAALSALFYAALFWAVSATQQASLVIYLGWLGDAGIKAAALALVVIGTIIAVGCLGSAFATRICHRTLRAVCVTLLGFTVLIPGALALFVALVFAVFTAGSTYQTFVSPDGTHSVMVAEDGLGYGAITQNVWGPIYQTRAGYGTNDFYRSVEHGTYQVSWTPTTFTLTYQYDSSSAGSATATITLEG